MEILQPLMLVVFFVVSIAIVGLVIVQEPKQGAGDFMGQSSTDLFNSRGTAGQLYKITGILGLVFAVAVFTLSRI